MSSKNGGIPLVVKILVGVALVGTLFFGGLLWFASTLVKFDESSVKTLTDSMIEFKAPLNSDYAYRFGATLGDMKVAKIDYKPLEQEIYVASLASKNQSTDTDEVLSKLTAASGKGASTFKSQSKANMTVGCETLQYELGSLSRKSKVNQEEVPAFIGVCPKDSAGRTFFIFAGQRTGTQIEMKPIQTLLDDVVSFK